MCPSLLPIDSRKKPILIVARRNSGLSVLAEAFGNRHGVFLHEDSLDELLDHSEDSRIVETLLLRLGNLGRCAVDPGNRDAFKKSNRKTVDRNDFVRHACRHDRHGGDDDGVCVTSSALLSRVCEKFPVRVSSSSTLPMKTARQLMIANPSLNVIYLFRDPRAVVNTRSQNSAGNFDFVGQSKSFCQNIQVKNGNCCDWLWQHHNFFGH